MGCVPSKTAHPACGRVVVHSRRSKIEANNWATNTPLRALVPGSDVPNQKVTETGGLATLGCRLFCTLPADAGLDPKEGCGRWGAALRVQDALSAWAPSPRRLQLLPGPLHRWGIEGLVGS